MKIYQIKYSDGLTVGRNEQDVIAEAKTFYTEVYGRGANDIKTIDDAIEVYENLLHEVTEL